MDKLKELDPIIHQKTRFDIICLLSKMKKPDFNTLKHLLEINEGVLSRNLKTLKEIKYIEDDRIMDKDRRQPKTIYWLTDLGKERLNEYWRVLKDRLKHTENGK